MNRDHSNHASHSESFNVQQPVPDKRHRTLVSHCDNVACCRSGYGTAPLSFHLSDQVNIRGFRIQIREVELAVEHIEGVKQCMAAVWGDQRGDKQLVAYVLGDHQPLPSTMDLRRMLKQKLPNYMMPSVFIAVEYLPVTSNGEMDRGALPAPPPALLAYGEVFVEPSTPTEELLADIWSDALGVTRIGINDNFFELGGHPLLVDQVVSYMSQALQVELSVQILFEFQTIAELAPVVENLLLDGQRGANERYGSPQWFYACQHN